MNKIKNLLNRISNFFNSDLVMKKNSAEKIIHDNVEFNELEEIDLPVEKPKRAPRAKMKKVQNHES